MKQKIKVRFKAFDTNLLDQTVREIVNAVKRTGAQVDGPIPLPTRKTVVTVLRSPHGDKKSREQFETRMHKRLMYIIDPSPQTMDALMKLDISAGVDISMKQV
ncbi:MAG: 30S ribosomal protein S10 [Candidatus Lambdaproteobacteria bacterium]|nr:30S ribosomal protein S10 [Candidatus Lambdaproteobacteria bacterium]